MLYSVEKKEIAIMKKILNYVMKHKMAVNTLVFTAGTITTLSNWGCCFFIFHQPKLPNALIVRE